MLRISTSVDGDVVTTEKDLPDYKLSIDDEGVDTEDEMLHLEDFIQSPGEEVTTMFPEYYRQTQKSKVAVCNKLMSPQNSGIPLY